MCSDRNVASKLASGSSSRFMMNEYHLPFCRTYRLMPLCFLLWSIGISYPYA